MFAFGTEMDLRGRSNFLVDMCLAFSIFLLLSYRIQMIALFFSRKRAIIFSLYLLLKQ